MIVLTCKFQLELISHIQFYNFLIVIYDKKELLIFPNFLWRECQALKVSGLAKQLDETHILKVHKNSVITISLPINGIAMSNKQAF